MRFSMFRLTVVLEAYSPCHRRLNAMSPPRTKWKKIKHPPPSPKRSISDPRPEQNNPSNGRTIELRTLSPNTQRDSRPKHQPRLTTKRNSKPFTVTRASRTGKYIKSHCKLAGTGALVVERKDRNVLAKGGGVLTHSPVGGRVYSLEENSGGTMSQSGRL